MATLTALTVSSSSPPPPYPSFPAKKTNFNHFSKSQKPTKTPYLTPKKPHKSPQNKNQEDTTYAWSIPLHNKNPHAIYKDIQNFARKNKIKEALTILDYLEKLGIPVNVTTFNAVIGACTRSKCIIQAKQIHGHVRLNGLDNNEFIKTKIVQMYASCGSLDDAKRLFNDESESVYAWNALLRGNVVAGRRNYRELLSAFGRMRESGVELNEYSYSCMIKSFGGAVAFRQGLKMHGLLVKNGFIGSEMLMTSLIDMYFKCGRIRLAQMLFDEMSDRDVVVWGAMVAGFAHNGLRWEGIEYVRWMVREGCWPNSVVLTSVLPVIGEVGAWMLGKEVHAYMFKKRSYLEEPFIKSALIDMYCKCGDMDSGRKVFYNSKDRTTVSWTALMSGYISNGKLEQALRSVIWMQQEGFRPDVVSLATVLPVCTELRALRQGREIHGYLVKNDFLPNVSLLTSLIVMYSKCGVLGYSRKLFDGMEARNVIAWTAFMNSCVENKQLYEALGIFRSMQLSKHRADSVAMSRVLGICSELQLLKLGKEVHGQIFKKNIELVPHVSAGLVKFYGKCGMTEKAKLVFDLWPSHGLMAISAMIAAYGYNNYFRKALDLFYQVVESGGVPPNLYIFEEVLAICDQAGFGDEACKIFQLMTRTHRIKASKKHFSLMAGLLSRLGHVEEAGKYIHWSSRLDSKA